MSGSKPNYPAPEAEAPGPAGSESRVRPVTESDEGTLPPSLPVPVKRRALLLVDGAEDAASRGFDAELGERDLAPEHDTLPKVESPEAPPVSALGEKENLTGQLIDGRYQVDYVLGVGSMGIVYGARHVSVGKLVAVKALRAYLATDAEAILRFNAEATAATSIGNQHIVETFDFGRLPDGTAYLVMEYLEGRSLAELIEGWSPLPTARITRIAVQIAEALNAAHLAGIVHRDLKPDNVFLCERDGDVDFVKILDFGIAKFGVSQARLTQAGAVFGTPAYMSPEQAVGKATDGRTDVYALGVMLYEMACGSVPFQGEHAMAVLALHSNEEPEPLSARRPEVSAELEAIVHKCLQKDPDARYASMAELAADLSRLASGMPVRAEALPVASAASAELTEAPGPVLEPPASLPPSSRRFVAGGVPWPLVLLLLVAVAGGAYFFTKHRPLAVSAPVAAPVEPRPLPPPLPSAVEADDGAAEVEVALVLFPLDARVLRGSEDLGPMPVSVKVKEGQPVKVRIVREGYWTRRLTLDGSKRRLVVGLVKRSEPEVAVDDEPAGSLPRSVPAEVIRR